MPSALIPLQNSAVQVKVNKYKVFYEVQGEKKLVPARDMIHLKLFSENGIIGKNPLAVAANMLYGNAMMQDYSNKFFTNGANLSGVVEVPNKLSDKAYKNLKNSWNSKYSGLENSHKLAILEEGMKFNSISTNPQEQQLLESKEFGVNEIARLFGIPSHMIGSLEKATLNNIEHMSIQFVRYTMAPLFSNMEAEYSTKLLSEADKNVSFIKHDISELMRGDSKARAEFYRTAINFGIMTINEARKAEGLSPTEGGDTMMIQSNMSSLENVQTIGPDNSAPNTKNIEE